MGGTPICSVCGADARTANWQPDGSYDVVCSHGHRKRVRLHPEARLDVNRLLVGMNEQEDRKLPKIRAVRNCYKVFVSGLASGALPQAGPAQLQLHRQGEVVQVQLVQGVHRWRGEGVGEIPDYQGSGLVLSVGGPTNPGLPDREKWIYVVELSRGLTGPEIELEPVEEDQTLVQRRMRPRRRPDARKAAAGRQAHRQYRERYQQGVERWTKSPRGKAFYQKLARFNAAHDAAPEDVRRDLQRLLTGQDQDAETETLGKLLRGDPK